MRKLFLLVCLLSSICSVAAGNKKQQKKADADTQTFRYELEYIKSSGTGLVNVKVWGFSKNPNIAIEQAQKNALHGVIFKGYAGAGSTQPPIVKDATALITHAAFFDSFFGEGGEYMRYVSGTIGSPDIIKVNKEFKVGTIVQVNVALLRAHLEKAGIIRGLSSGF
jgi:hypothetical protein